jgi:hypothetical protein
MPRGDWRCLKNAELSILKARAEGSTRRIHSLYLTHPSHAISRDAGYRVAHFAAECSKQLIRKLGYNLGQLIPCPSSIDLFTLVYLQILHRTHQMSNWSGQMVHFNSAFKVNHSVVLLIYLIFLPLPPTFITGTTKFFPQINGTLENLKSLLLTVYYSSKNVTAH